MRPTSCLLAAAMLLCGCTQSESTEGSTNSRVDEAQTATTGTSADQGQLDGGQASEASVDTDPVVEGGTAMEPPQGMDRAGASAPQSPSVGDVPSAGGPGSAAPAIPAPAESPAGSSENRDSPNAPNTAVPSDGRPSMGETPLPCSVQRVLRASCQGCHARDPGQLAPMALVTREDLLAPAISDPGLRVVDLVGTRVQSAEAPMPPASSRPLTEDERAGLIELAQGIPTATEGCEDPADGGMRTPEAPDASEIDQCYRFVAHDREVEGDETPFSAPPGEYYGCFFFDIPWDDGAQAIAFRSLDTAITHHWALADTVQEFAPGAIVRDAPNCGLGAQHLLAVYGINQQKELNFPEGVGLELPGPSSGRGVLLGVHYFNQGSATTDQAGVEVCTAKEKRKNTATVSLLGSELFLLPPAMETTIEGYCTPNADGDIHVFRSFPHMHARGVSFESVVERAGGSEEVILDIAYDFNNQIMYETPFVLHAGDRIRTACHFVNDTERLIRVGDLEGDEMCANFVYAWPAHALQDGSRALSGAADTCLR